MQLDQPTFCLSALYLGGFQNRPLKLDNLLLEIFVRQLLVIGNLDEKDVADF
jgi:hypothetical protein